MNTSLLMTYAADTAGLIAALPVLADGWTRLRTKLGARGHWQDGPHDHDDHEDDDYFDDCDPDEPERDDGPRQDWIRLGDGVFMICHTLPDGHMLVGYAVRQPGGGYRMTMPRLPRSDPRRCWPSQGHSQPESGIRTARDTRQRRRQPGYPG